MTRFKAPVEYRRTTEGRDSSSLSRFPGMPLGVQLYSDWWIQYLTFNRAVDLPVTATSWTSTLTGVSGVTLSDDLFPPHLIMLNAAADNDSQEWQWTAADAGGEIINLATDRPVYFETMIKVHDANDDQSSVEQVDWFVGLAVTDTTVLDGCTDYVGFSKVDQDSDATNRIAFVCGDGGGGAAILRDQSVTSTGWTMNNPAVDITVDRPNRVVGPTDWVKLAFLIEPRVLGTVGDAFVWVNDEPIPANPINVSGFIPDENICLTLCVQNGEAVAKIMNVAYVLLASSYRTTSAALLSAE